MSDVQTYVQTYGGDLVEDCLRLVEGGDLDGAQNLLSRVGSEPASQRTDERDADLRLAAGIVAYAAGDIESAAADLSLAVSQTRKFCGSLSGVHSFLQATHYLAMVRRSEGQYLAARQLLTEALSISEIKNASLQDVAVLHNELGIVCKYEGLFDEAAAYYEKALLLLESIADVEDSDTASVYHNIGGLEFSRGDYAAAEMPARRAVAIRERALGQESELVAADKAALSPILFELGKMDEAEKLLREALQILESLYGADHYEVAISIGNLAAIAQSRGRLEEAEALYTRALGALEQHLGPEHPEIAPVLHNLGLLTRNRDPEQGRALLVRASEILSSSVRSTHPTLSAITEALQVSDG
ncbi:tetratricopeptide repeat protein [Streptomyces sp900105245]|uniref:Tetratricopeptide repeat protein n=1 Tax=Streptomyces sp. 900105245 TaxID=3154379 RepID=A0ABV1UMP1_9ACTN